MNARHKRGRVPAHTGHGEDSFAFGERPIPTQAYDYHDDIDPDVVRSIQERANTYRSGEKLVVIDGYVGDK